MMNQAESSNRARAVAHAKNVLDQHGYEILDVSWQSANGDVADLVVQDKENTLIFVKVSYRDAPDEDGEVFPKEDYTEQERISYERLAFDYLRTHGVSEMRVRFDAFAYCAMGSSDYAYVRHHIDALSWHAEANDPSV